jgi:ABC-type dipeptide/oligopeptide/nickel transport system permease subunit
MPEKLDTMPDAATAKAGISAFKRFRRVFFGRKIVIFGLIIILLLIIAAIFAPVLAPYDPYKQDLDSILIQPSREHVLGTDALGRDTLSRVIYGAQVSLIVGITAIIMAGTIGMALGLIAGYFGRMTYAIIMRCVDALMSLPMMVLVLVIAAMLGGGLKNVVVALGVSGVAMYARMMCGQTLTIRENDYIMVSRAMGASNIRIMMRHLLPNSFPPMIVLMTMQMGTMILAEAGLSFLGVGVEPPKAAWGAMVTDGYRYLFSNPILSFAPGLAVMLVVFAFNMVGDGLRDALDPRLRGRI